MAILVDRTFVSSCNKYFGSVLTIHWMATLDNFEHLFLNNENQEQNKFLIKTFAKSSGNSQHDMW